MNPQSYRNKLEKAIEQRDQHLLDELENIAMDSPATARLWQDHLLLENAISQWVDSPAHSQSATSDCSQEVITTKEVAKTTRSRQVFWTTISSLACLACVGWFAVSGNQTINNQSPAFVATTPAVIQVDSTDLPVSTNDRDNENVRTRGPFTRVSHSYDLVDQGLALLPNSVIPSVIPDVTNQISDEVNQTWNKISMLPEEAQQVWNQFLLSNPTMKKMEKRDSPASEEKQESNPVEGFSLFNMLS